MITKWKDYKLHFGMAFTTAVAIFAVAFTWVVFGDESLFLRMRDYLYDCGIDAMGGFICAALYFGCLKQKSGGIRSFRALIILACAGFLANALMYFTKGAEELSKYTIIFIMASKLIDLVMIGYFYQYVKISLDFKDKLTEWADRAIPFLLVLEILVVLSNFFYPLTFAVGPLGEYQAAELSILEDIYLIFAAVVTTLLIIRSDNPRNQKVAALTFIFLPVLNYAANLGEFGNASQYGMIVMSLIVMYCLIFNDRSSKLAATQTELNMATEIQAGMLPSIFPAFPNRKEFDLYATMDPAKEVGGDFYDFFMIDDNHLGVVMADVSGKGVPAALFMMISKTVVQNYAKLGIGAAEVLTKANAALCVQNRMEMFVTTWIGILEISTGKMNCASAGHEYPAIYRDGKFELFKDKHGLVLGGMDGAKYKDYDIELRPGDKIFVYTDGVPEAMNSNGELFGTDRMIAALNSKENQDPTQVLKTVRAAVDDYVGNAEQFDDLTMLCLEYRGIDEEGTEEN